MPGERVTDQEAVRLSPEDLAEEAMTSVARVEELTDAGLLKPDSRGHEAGDVHRIRLIDAFEAGGVPHQVLVSAADAGVISLEHYPDLHGERGPLSGRSYAEFHLALRERGAHLQRLFGAFGLPEPDEDARLTAGEEDLLDRLTSIMTASEPVLVLRSARLFGDGARRVTEAIVGIYDEAAQRIQDVPRVPSGPAYERLLSPWAAFAQLAPSLAAWLSGEHLRHAIDAYSIGHTEQVLAAWGYVQARQTSPTAIAFVDVTGFTRLAQERGDEEAARVALVLGEVCRTVATSHGGRLVKLLGDGALLQFDGMSSAARACIDMLPAMRQAGLPPGHIGISAGPVVVREGDVYGRTVNTAARLSDLAPAGEIYITEDDSADLRSLPVVLDVVGSLELQGIGAARVVTLRSHGPTA